MSFLEAKAYYYNLRRKQRDTISKYLRSDSYFKANGAKVFAKSGSIRYKSGGRLEVAHSLTNWLWIEVELNGVNFFLSLQAFDRDPRTGNVHVLMDRIGIYAYGENYSAIDAQQKMMITDIELPVDETKLENLANIIKKLSECKVYEMQSHLKSVRNKYNLV